MTNKSTIADSITAENHLAKLGLHLPDAPTPFGAYVPAVQTGNLLFLSGMLATSGHTATVFGVVGKNIDVNTGREAARTAALNVLALTKKQLGSLNNVSRVVSPHESLGATRHRVSVHSRTARRSLVTTVGGSSFELWRSRLVRCTRADPERDQGRDRRVRGRGSMR